MPLPPRRPYPTALHASSHSPFISGVIPNVDLPFDPCTPVLIEAPFYLNRTANACLECVRRPPPRHPALARLRPEGARTPARGPA